MPDQPGFTYRAFLSYSHKDRKAARRWRRRLEALRIPEDHRGRPTPLGPVPETLAPIFHDRVDFPTGQELGPETDKALSESAALILLASPDAAKSHYVNEEVRQFRHRYPDRPLVVVLEAKRGTRFSDCLPPAIRFVLDEHGQVTDSPHSVLAADPRPGADGERQATAKVAAALTGLRNEDLISRVDDLLRRERWWRNGIVAVVALVALSGAAGGWMLFEQGAQQRREDREAADRRQAELLADNRRRDAAAEAWRAELRQMFADSSLGGPAAARAFARFRDLLRPKNPDIDSFPDDKLPEVMERTMARLSEPGANLAGLTSAARQAMETAQTRIQALDLTGATTILKDELAKSATVARDRAAMLAELGRVEGLALRYRESAQLYSAASGAVLLDAPVAWRYAMGAAYAMYLEGYERGDNDALVDAISRYQAAQLLAPRERPRDRAATQSALGAALFRLGERQAGTARLHEAATAFRAALEEQTAAATPAEWADTLTSFAQVLRTLGSRESGTERLHEAVSAYRAVLSAQDRRATASAWARTQVNLGNALSTLGERESGTARLEEAVTAFRAALEEYTRDRVPLDWAMTQNNLGNALQTLGERESGTARLEEAVTAFRAALEERTRDRVPLDWAATQSNLGNALNTLGGRESGTARLEEAVTAFRAALEEYTRDRVPLNWATTQNNLGNALQILGGRESGTARLEEAVTAYRAALEERTRDRVPLDWAMTQNNLGNALQTLGARESGTAWLEEAVTAYRAALEERTRDRVPLDWAGTRYNMSIVLALLAEQGRNRAALEEAVACAHDAVTVYREANITSYLPRALQLLGLVEALLAALPAP